MDALLEKQDGRRVHHEITQITKKLKMADFFREIA